MEIIEQWKPIDGFEGFYAVSNLGRVKSLGNDKSRKEKILKPINNGKDYLQVGLWRDGKYKMFLVHRLVATAFIPNPEGLPEVNHKDENPLNNAKSNIEWVSRNYNINYGTRNERSAAARKNDLARSKAVEASRFSDFREIELRFPSTNEAGRNGYNQVSVAACCRGCYCSKGNFYKNLYWRFSGLI